MGALLALAGLLQGALTLRMAAFNIRTFGETKMSNATLSKYIVQASPGQPVPREPQGWLWRWLKQVLGREGSGHRRGCCCPWHAVRGWQQPQRRALGQTR